MDVFDPQLQITTHVCELCMVGGHMCIEPSLKHPNNKNLTTNNQELVLNTNHYLKNNLMYVYNNFKLLE